MISDLAALCISPDSTVRQAMACIDGNIAHLALVVDKQLRLLDTITDGDVRRAILAGVDLDSPVTMLEGRRTASPYPVPVTAPVGTESVTLLGLMRKRQVRHIPLLDETGRVSGLATLAELLPSDTLSLEAVVMAGGYGQRLRPLTLDLPKPMLPVGNRPLLERIIGRLREAGIQRVSLATHYKGELIAEHFKDGREFGVEINYVREDQPMGTAGALSLLGESDSPLLVINGDILTEIDFHAMLEFHQDNSADMTVGIQPREFQIPYGVVEINEVAVTGITEKPLIRHFINAGIYLLSPGVLRHIPIGQSYDMPDLIDKLVAEGRRVVGFPIREYWMDIGHIEDYHKAIADVETGREAPSGN